MSPAITARRATYLAVLAGCLAATAPLEAALGTRVYRRPRRLARAVAPVALAFALADRAAFRRGWWRLDPAQTTGLRLPGGLPLEEALFFAVIPTCAVLTLEAVRSRRPGWPVGDEATQPQAPQP